MVKSPETQTRPAIPQPEPVRVSRSFAAPRTVVFAAWSTAAHVKRWFSPETYTVSDARVDMRPGGAFEVCMRGPDGRAHWSRGAFLAVEPHDRLVVEMGVVDDRGAELFRATTEVTFTDDVVGTRMDVVQTYSFSDPAAAPMVAGAPEGWRTTLDKLQKEIVAMQGGGAVSRSVVHAMFHLERTYDARIGQVWRAITDEAAKSKWFGGPPGLVELMERHMDVRVGGRERMKVRWNSGVVTTFDAVYHDVIPNERLVYTYEMHLDETKISVSLATMQLKAEGGKTVLKVTEQGAFLDGYDDAGSREHGTSHLLDLLGASLTDEAT